MLACVVHIDRVHLDDAIQNSCPLLFRCKRITRGMISEPSRQMILSYACMHVTETNISALSVSVNFVPALLRIIHIHNPRPRLTFCPGTIANACNIHTRLASRRAWETYMQQCSSHDRHSDRSSSLLCVTAQNTGYLAVCVHSLFRYHGSISSRCFERAIKHWNLCTQFNFRNQNLNYKNN